MMTPPSERLRGALLTRGHAWPAPIEHFTICDSTNDRLKERARAGAPEWSVVLADAQAAGRGRLARPWISPPGNLHLSVLLRPPCGEASLLPLAAGVAVAEAVAPLGVEPELKWPNDILVRGRKLAGILAEASSGASGLEWVVVGIGVNLNAEVPAELDSVAASLAAESGRLTDREEAAASVLARLSVWYHALVETGPAFLLDAWRARAVAWWGQAVEARSGEQAIRGVARGVDERGALVLELEDGSRRAVLCGDVRELRLARPEAGTCS